MACLAVRDLEWDSKGTPRLGPPKVGHTVFQTAAPSRSSLNSRDGFLNSSPSATSPQDEVTNREPTLGKRIHLISSFKGLPHHNHKLLLKV